MWIQTNEQKAGTFHETPDKILETDPSTLRCTKESVLGFVEDDTTFYACPYHAPIELLEDLNIPLPRDRQRSDTIQV